MFTLLRRVCPTGRTAVIAAAIMLAAVGGASARSGPSGSGNGSHSDGDHHAGPAMPVRMIGPPIIVVKPGHGHHHHVRIRFFDNWYWASACVHYPSRYDDAPRRTDWRWYGLVPCHYVDEPYVY